MTIDLGRLDRRRRPRRRPASVDPSNRTSRTSGAWRRWTKYSWNSSQPSSVRTSVRTGLVGHRQDRRRDPERCLERPHDLGQRRALAEPCRPRDVRREVAVAEPEPVLLAVLGQAVHHGPGLAGDGPSPARQSKPGEHVHDRVVVGHHEQAVPLGVVAGVDDDRQVARGEDGLEPVRPASRRRSRRRGRRPSRVTRGARGPRPSGRSSRGRTARASGR